MNKSSEKEIWVYIDLRNERLFGLCLNVLAAARALAGSMSGNVVAIILGSPVKEKRQEPAHELTRMPLDASIEACIANGADRVYSLEHPELAWPRSDIHAGAVTNIIQECSPLAVLFSLTDFGREIAARCARMCNAGLIADCANLRNEDGRIIADCPSWGGEIMAELAFSDPASTGFATVQPQAFQAAAVRGFPGTVERIEIEELKISKKLELISSSVEQAKRRRLEDAKIVVVGGAGVENVEGFGLVRDLAAALGGEVAATRPPVLHHWIDGERLIGQTGKTVRPELLVSIGTSGAIQYTAGIMESKTIMAINRDPDSPIFHVADVGIVADARTLLPLITTRVRTAVMRDLADVLGEERTDGKETGFGEKVRKLRESHGWTLEDISKHTGQSPEAIQLVERNEVAPSVSFLLRLSKALNVDPGTFLRDEEKAAIQDQRAQAFIKRTKNYYYQTLTPGAENQHLRGFMITIEPRQAHKPVAYKHEGEEFIYVMEGSLELTLDNKINHLKVGESIHYNSEVPHKLKNNSNETTRCLVMLYTP
ncbi:FAD-binding protein [Thermodesulfobacteriota bacterium]